MMTGKMRQIVWVLFGVAVAGGSMSKSLAGDHDYDKGDTVVCGKDCRPGGGVPFPFLEANQQFELADGSPYNLYGTILIARAPDGSGDWTAYLEVDLKKHVWLANDRRRQDARYPLLGSTRFWRQFDGAYVRLGGTAQLNVLWHEKGYTKAEVMLAAAIFKIEKMPSRCQ